MPEVMALDARLHEAIRLPVSCLSKSITWTSRSCTTYKWLPCDCANGLSQSSLNTTMPASCPTATRFEDRCATKTQKRSFSRRKVWMPVLRVTSQTRIVRSSEFDRIKSFFGWKRQQETLLKWPRSVSTSQALESFILQSLMSRSSAPETINGSVGWNEAQLTPRSWPSSTYLTTASEVPNTSPPPCGPLGAPLPMETRFSRRPEVSQTRTVWSSEADTIKSSLGWKCAHMT
mmetsp:Transcript_53769/g.154363  ORF Transcript_53769/g.154363 Transcript_53769/m.154363 type:complete len:232 (-) Transcript_53769:595-1290(-)